MALPTMWLHLPMQRKGQHNVALSVVLLEGFPRVAVLDSHSSTTYSSSPPSTQEDAFLSKYDGSGGGVRVKRVGYHPCMLELERSHSLVKAVKSGTTGGGGQELCKRTH